MMSGNAKGIGLCIVYKNCNYGSILQSYATLLKLQSMGYRYEIINYSPRKNLFFYFKSLPRLLNRDMLYGKIRASKRKIGLLLHKEYRKNNGIRNAKFKEFVDVHFDRISEQITDYESLKRYAAQYDSVLVGSDQLWLPSGLATGFYNLMFVPDEVCKIAYSTSFGVSKIPFYQRKRTAQFLNRIEYISVREKTGVRIVKSLTHKKCYLTLDPTMILDRSVWDRSIRDEVIIEGDYVFCYFLGRNRDHRNEVRKFANRMGLKIVYLRHLDEYIPEDESFGDISPYDIGPAEFVNLIRHASYICTDSFHGTVFSLLYHKQFITFERYKKGKNSRNSRIETLFSNVGADRLFNGDLTSEMLASIDYDTVDRQIEKMRSRSSRFIECALSKATI